VRLESLIDQVRLNPLPEKLWLMIVGGKAIDSIEILHFVR
jgi:hypothetical protein